MVDTIIARPPSGAPTSKTTQVSSTATGTVFTLKRILGGSSTLSLVSGSNSNLTLSGLNITATAALGSGASQKAIVREVNGDVAVEYAVTITTAGSASTAPFATGTWNDAGAWDDSASWKDAA